MKIYTKTGDQGQTSLCRGERISKDSPRIEACGEVDELNSWIGWARAENSDRQVEAWLEQIQRDLFIIGADLASPRDNNDKEDGTTQLTENSITLIEQAIDQMEAQLPPLKKFILPGGCEPAARLHLARTVCRRAERATVRLAKQETVNPLVLVYLNRLSDFLFVLARYVNRIQGVSDQLWKNNDK